MSVLSVAKLPMGPFVDFAENIDAHSWDEHSEAVHHQKYDELVA